MRTATLLFALGAPEMVHHQQPTLLRGGVMRERKSDAPEVAAAAAAASETRIPPKLSVWLLPPEGPVRTRLQQQINNVAAEHNNKNSPTSKTTSDKDYELPRFAPHVTVLGGMTLPTEFQDDPDEWSRRVLTQLESRLGGTGQVKCRFEPVLQSAINEDGSVQWNQACVAVMKRDPSFQQAVELAHLAFGEVEGISMDGQAPFEWTSTLKPPLFEPHYSIAYGYSRNLCQGVKVPEDFDAAEAMLIWTYPASVEGVSKWKEVGTFSLS